MASQKLLLSFLLFSLLAGHKAVHGSSHHNHNHSHSHHLQHGNLQNDSRSTDCFEEPAFKPAKLFVFGDSYADTGNNKKSEARSWKVPYGMTFPRFPTGRYSDGLIFTDFIARFFRVRSPVPVQSWTGAYWAHLTFGTNFAYGGTGVFDTLSSDPNMTAQIDCFERLIGVSHFKAAIAQSSVALVTNAGNDYDTFLAKGGDAVGLFFFIYKVVDKLAANMKRLHTLGVKKVAVAALQPLGCLPQFTSATSFKKCNDTINSLVGFHNQWLKMAVDNLNNGTSPSTFVIVDLYKAFTTVIVNSTTFKNPFKPCCMGVSSEYNCGNVDANGTKMYTVCEDPSAHFFWDMFHPTQAGWNAVVSTLGQNLLQL